MAPGVEWVRSGSGLAGGCIALALLLTACDQRPVPKPTQDSSQSAPSAELLGAPAPPPANQTTAADPATPAADPGEEPAADAPPPQPDPLRPPDVSMAPIPDPAPPTSTPARAATAAATGAPAPASVAPRPAPRPAEAARAATHATPPAAPAPSVAGGQDAPMAGAPVEGPTSSEDRGPRADAFQAAALKALHRGAQLTLPTKADPGQPGQATLTLPASFGAALRKALAASGLADAGAPVNITATLTAPGQRIEPDSAQSLPLQAGQPTEFHWIVTPEAGARRATGRAQTHVEVCVEAPAGAEPICIGQIAPSGPGLKLNSQLLGIVLLLVIVGLVIAWLAQHRRAPPSRSAAARRAARQAAQLAEADGASGL